ncbi:MAG: hypothetical protein HC877_23940 [Thioploca sp.]|nr:hypothetical protein [Thioploca sp.]
MYKVINVPKNTKLMIVGDIHEQIDQFEELVRKYKPSKNNIFVSVGDIFDKGSGEETAYKIINRIKNWREKSIGYMVRGNHEQKHINRNKNKLDETPLLKWVSNQPRVISFIFPNQVKITILHAGVIPKHTENDLYYNSEVMYVRWIDEYGDFIPLKWIKSGESKILVPAKPGGIPWHDKYDGRFGYIVSGHEAQADGKVKFYKHSCNIDTKCYETGILSAVIFSENKREEIIQIKQ